MSMSCSSCADIVAKWEAKLVSTALNRSSIVAAEELVIVDWTVSSDLRLRRFLGVDPPLLGGCVADVEREAAAVPNVVTESESK